PVRYDQNLEDRTDLHDRTDQPNPNRPIEIGDLTKEESIEYLVNKRKIKEEAANNGRAFKDIKQSILSITEKKLKSARIDPKQKYHKVACQIINSLLTTKELEYMKYLQIFDNVEESQSVELYIKTKADDFGVKLIDLTPADEYDATTSNQVDTVTLIIICIEEYPSITEEPSHQHPSNLKSPRENYESKNHSSVSS
ncbi:537_t:CDS:2, partial [Funneliformis geosporum]